jgi:hypothetical protein
LELANLEKSYAIPSKGFGINIEIIWPCTLFDLFNYLHSEVHAANIPPS